MKNTMTRSNAAAVFDIDNYNRVNDSFGHQAGDEALCELVRVAR